MDIYGYNLRFSETFDKIVLDTCILEKDGQMYYWIFKTSEQNIKNILDHIHSKTGFLIPTSNGTVFSFCESHLEIRTETVTAEQIEGLYGKDLEKCRL